MIDVAFVSSVAVIAADPPGSRRLFLDVLGLPLAQHDTDDYFSSEAIEGSKHFGVWPLAQAAEACFGTYEWPADRPVPQASIEFDVASSSRTRPNVAGSAKSNGTRRPAGALSSCSTSCSHLSRTAKHRDHNAELLLARSSPATGSGASNPSASPAKSSSGRVVARR